MINNVVKKLDEKLIAQDGKINLLQNRIATLEQQVKKIEKLEERVDDCEQYSRRLCVKIDNMAVPSGVKEDCLSKVVQTYCRGWIPTCERIQLIEHIEQAPK